MNDPEADDEISVHAIAVGSGVANVLASALDPRIHEAADWTHRFAAAKCRVAPARTRGPN